MYLFTHQEIVMFIPINYADQYTYCSILLIVIIKIKLFPNVQLHCETATILSLLIFLGYKFQRNGINAVPDVFGCKTFALKYMAKVTPATSTGYFGTTAVGIEGALYGPFDFILESGPATTTVKLVGRAVQRGIAFAAMVSALFKMVGVLAGKGSLGSLFLDHIPLKFVQLVVA